MSSSTPPLTPDHFVAPVSETPVQAVDQVRLSTKRSNLWSDAWRDLRRRPLFWVSSALILLVLVVAIAPQLFTPLDPTYCVLIKSNDPATATHIFGYNRQGCDTFARVLYGTRNSLSVGLIVIVLSGVIGTVVGAIAGFFGGWFDAVLSRIGDIFFSIPYILAAIVVVSVLSQYVNVFVIALAIGAFSWPITARVMRSEVLRVKNADFVTAATALGQSRFSILMRHVLPNSIAPVLVIATLSLGAAITAEATLSFLGLGLKFPAVSWGGDIAQAQVTLRTNPLALIWPSAALTVTVLSFILLGETLRDALDPKARATR